MALGALTVRQDETEINAAFMRNHRGDVCIAFSDPAYVRSDAVMIDPADLSVYAVIHQSSYLIGSVSETMARAFAENEQALLTALRPDGSVYELFVPIQIGNA